MTYTQPKSRPFSKLLNDDDGSNCRYEPLANEELREVPSEVGK